MINAIRNKKHLWIIIFFVLTVGISGMMVFALLSLPPNPIHTVTFMCNNLVIDEVKVKHLSSVAPPAVVNVPEGKVFTGWDLPLENIERDTLIKANLISAADQNMFTLDSVYVKRGGEAHLPLRLQGQVNLAGFELLITYSNDELKFKEFLNIDKDVLAHCAPETGEVKIAFASGNNVDGLIDICDIVFESKGKTNASEVKIINILATQLYGNEVQKAKTVSIPATIYFY